MFSCGRAKTIKKRKVWTRICLQTEENVSVFNQTGYVWTGPQLTPAHASR